MATTRATTITARTMAAMGMATTKDTMATLAMITLATTMIAMAMVRATVTTTASRAATARRPGKAETTRTTINRTDLTRALAINIWWPGRAEDSTLYPGGSLEIFWSFLNNHFYFAPVMRLTPKGRAL